MSQLDICYLPTQWRHLQPARLQASLCVVIDVIRATTTLVTALGHDARSVRPVASVAEAYALKEQNPAALLAGERHGQALPGFDLGNSPREVTAERVAGRDIILTTTNGTQALAACQGARGILTASFANLSAVAARMQKIGPPWIILCAGFEGDFGLDDAIVAGALAEELGEDHTFTALYRGVKNDLLATLQGCAAGQELRQVGLAEDIPLCAELNRFSLVPTQSKDGTLHPE